MHISILALLASPILSAKSEKPPSNNDAPTLLVWAVGNKGLVRRYAGPTAKLARRVARAMQLRITRVSKEQRKKLAHLRDSCAKEITDACLERAADIGKSQVVLTVFITGKRKRATARAQLHEVGGQGPLAEHTGEWRRNKLAKDTAAFFGVFLPHAKRAAAKLGSEKVEDAPAAVAVAGPDVAYEPNLVASTAQQPGSSDAKVVPAETPSGQPTVADGDDLTTAQDAARFDVDGWKGGHSDDPILIHALAMNAELDGDKQEALKLVRQAHALAPEDAYFTFELARIAYEAQSDNLATDATAFLSRGREKPAERMLKGRILERLGRHDEARAYLTSTIPATGADTTPLAVQRTFELQSPSTKRQGGDWLTIILNAAAAYDTNISVLPDDATTSHDAGARATLSGSVIAAPKLAGIQLTVFSSGQLSRHFGDANLEQYDVGAGVVGASVQHSTDALRTTLTLTATDMYLNYLNGSPDHFMRDGRAKADSRLLFRRAELGLYASGGYRDFDWGNEKGSTNRDGGNAEGGLVGSLRLPLGLSLRATVGGQVENAKGRQQREQGALALMALHWRRRDLSVAASMDYRLRYYRRGQEDRSVRQESRVTPSAQVRYSVLDNWAVTASVTMMKNFSNAGNDYTRNMTQLGVGTRW